MNELKENVAPRGTGRRRKPSRSWFAALCAAALTPGGDWTAALAAPGQYSYQSAAPQAGGIDVPLPMLEPSDEAGLPDELVLRSLAAGNSELSEAAAAFIPEPGGAAESLPRGFLAPSPAARAASALDEPQEQGGPIPAKNPSASGGTNVSKLPAPPPAKPKKPLRPTQGIHWPAKGPITSPFGMRWGRHHDGIDIGAPYGANIRAAKAGRVILAGWFYGYGKAVMIDHGHGVKTLYGHASVLIARRGQRVEAGQRLAKVGCTGHCFGPHLHFEIRLRGHPVNPLRYLPRR